MTQNQVGFQPTFVADGHLQGYADDANQVFSGHQGSKDGTDPQRFPFAFVNELWYRQSPDYLSPDFNNDKKTLGVINQFWSIKSTVKMLIANSK